MGARRYHVTRSIDAHIDAVWEILTDASSYPEWNEAVLSLDGTIARGSTIRLMSIADPKRTFELSVTELEAPTTMVWRDGMPLGLFEGRRTFTLAPADDGGCDFSMVEEFSGLLAPLITKAIPDLTESFAVFADSLVAAATASRT